MTLITDSNGNRSVRLDAQSNDGVAWISGLDFESGVIEFGVKGKNIPQQSFVGIAFHGTNDSTFEVIYFRPFNFGSDDTTRKNHSVQYVYLPKFDWSFLRDRYPGKYEHSTTNPPNPENWFHAKILIEPGKIAVFENNDQKASLIVKTLNTTISGKVGFWVGNNSEGDFSNLSVKRN
jgi:hypothetical protein